MSTRSVAPYRCYIGLGANLATPEQAITSALNALAQHPHISAVQCSSLYQSKPMGPQDQPDYTNAVATLQSELAPLDLLDLLQQIENQHGRVRNQHWGPRTLDLDILLLYQNNAPLTIQTPRLSVPHPGLELREFVLIPLAEIAPTLDLPSGNSVQWAAANIPKNGLHIIAHPPITSL